MSRYSIDISFSKHVLFATRLLGMRLHGACVEVTGLQPFLETVRWRLPVAHVKEDG